MPEILAEIDGYGTVPCEFAFEFSDGKVLAKSIVERGAGWAMFQEIEGRGYILYPGRCGR